MSVHRRESSNSSDGGEAVDSFYVLPEGCIANVLSFTTPRDVCRLSSVSTVFKSAAESDAVWERFLPPGYQSIISKSECSSSSLSKKQLYFSLCDNPIHIDGGKKTFSLDKQTGKKCFMISARDLSIVWGDTPTYWRWTSIPEARFPEVAELICVCWLEIRGEISTGILSPETVYTAHLVFKSTIASYGFEHQPVEVTVGIAGSEVHKKTVYLDSERERRQQQRYNMGSRRRAGLFGHRSRNFVLQQTSVPRDNDGGPYPKERGDGWLEIELGEFFTGGGEDGDLEMSVLEVTAGDWKGGLIIQGIEIRPKRSK